jgi:hypothetical protein
LFTGDPIEDPDRLPHEEYDFDDYIGDFHKLRKARRKKRVVAYAEVFPRLQFMYLGELFFHLLCGDWRAGPFGVGVFEPVNCIFRLGSVASQTAWTDPELGERDYFYDYWGA